MLKFLKTLFNEDKTVVGLYAFDFKKNSGFKTSENFNRFQINPMFKPNFKENVLL